MSAESHERRQIRSHQALQAESLWTSGKPVAHPLNAGIGEIMASTAPPPPSAKRAARSTYSLPPRHQTALDEMSASTGLTKNELIRQAIGLLTIAVTARERGLVLALANDEDKVLSHIVSSL
jgi:hypothetical protein